MNKQGATLSAIGGHIVDMYRLAMFEVKNPHSFSKVRQIKALGKRTKSRLFIEAGTFLGNTAMRCSGAFEKVITLELDPNLYQQAKKYLSRRKNVLCLEGDASILLPAVLEKPDVSDALILLDGHFSGGITAHGELAEPACDELISLARYKDKINAIIVDDFRCFGRDKGYPKRSNLIETVENSFGDGFDFTIHMDQLLVWRVASGTRQ